MLPDRVIDIEFAPYKDRLLLAAAFSDGMIRIFRPKEILSTEGWMVDNYSFTLPYEIRCISWSQCIYEPPMLAIGCAKKSTESEDLLQIWFEKTGEQETIFVNLGVSGIINYKKTITDVAWAPFIGKTFNLLAVASEDKLLTLWKICGKISGKGDCGALNIEMFSIEALSAIVSYLVNIANAALMEHHRFFDNSKQ